jgi:PEP-CTERM motif
MKFDLLTSVSAIALGGLAAVFVAEPALAGSTSQTLSLSNVRTELSDSNSTLTFNDFDAATGQHLNSVVISLGGWFDSSGTIESTTAGSTSFTYKLSMSMSVYQAAGQPSLTLPTFQNAAVTSQKHYTNILQDVPQNFTASHVLLASASETLNSDLGGFEGTGTFSVYFISLTGSTFSGNGGNGTTNLITTASPSLTVTYNYTSTGTPAPEPASLAVFGMAMAGLGVARRRRKS